MTGLVLVTHAGLAHELLAAAEMIAVITSGERMLMESPERPIVLVRKRGADSLSGLVAPGSRQIDVVAIQQGRGREIRHERTWSELNAQEFSIRWAPCFRRLSLWPAECERYFPLIACDDDF